MRSARHASWRCAASSAPSYVHRTARRICRSASGVQPAAAPRRRSVRASSQTPASPLPTSSGRSSRHASSWRRSSMSARTAARKAVLSANALSCRIRSLRRPDRLAQIPWTQDPAKAEYDRRMRDPQTSSRLRSVLTQIWCEILKLDEVRPEDDFFRLGGDSLRAIEMLAAVDDVLLTPIEFPEFIDAPTISGLAASIEQSRAHPRAAAAAAAAAERSGLPPCTFAQERLWFLDQLSGPTGAYNMPLGTRIRGRLDVDALERSIREVVRRHSALRTTFAAEAGKPYLVVSDEPRFDFEQLDLSAESDPEAAVQQAVDSFVSTPFDLERGPLVRALLVRVTESDHVLELVFDHTVCDGWSHVVIFDELGTLYDGYRRGEDPRLPPPELQYDDHARRERARLTDAVI